MTNDGTKRLATAIIAQAVADWRMLENHDSYNQKYNGLRRFFKSEWCEWLCAELGVEAKDILSRLEAERKSRIDEKEAV